MRSASTARTRGLGCPHGSIVSWWSGYGAVDDDGRMELAAKLQLKAGEGLTVVGDPARVPQAVRDLEGAGAKALIAFAVTREDLAGNPVIPAAREDRLAWIAYPKAGKLNTDLNRDVLRELVAEQGVQTVRQVAIDDVWSALRIRPA
jgi:hypothetical protein